MGGVGREAGRSLGLVTVPDGLPPHRYSWVSATCVRLDSKEIKPVHPKGNQPRTFTGRTDTEAEALLLWPLNVKDRLIGKDPDAGED